MARTYMHTYGPGYMKRVSQVSRSMKSREVAEGVRGLVMQPMALDLAATYSRNMKSCGSTTRSRDDECEATLGSLRNKATKQPR